MDQVKLVAPLLEVTMDDGSTWQVQATNRDLIAWDRTRARQRPPWPAMDAAPFLWLTFLAWSASAREGSTPLNWADFETACLAVTNVGDDDDEDETGTPTQPGLEPG